MRVVCLGDPVADVLGTVDQSAFELLGISEGGCEAVSHAEFAQLAASVPVKDPFKRTSGGSAANVAKGLAGLLSGGNRVGFAGRIGNDDAGRAYEQELQEQHVESLLCRSEDEATASCLCLVTSDGQRTMRTHLAAAAGLKNSSQLPANWLQGATLLHMEGYVLYRPQLAREAVQSAKKCGALVSLDLSSFELVEHCKETLLAILEEGGIDIVTCNEEEACAFAKVIHQEPERFCPSGASCKECQKSSVPKPPSCGTARSSFRAHVKFDRKPLGNVSVVSLGAKGCILQGKGKSPVRCAAPSAPVKDTVGAGDYFTAGVLYAYLLKQDLQVCGYVGCCLGSASVQQDGASLDRATWDRVKADIKKVINT